LSLERVTIVKNIKRLGCVSQPERCVPAYLSLWCWQYYKMYEY